MVDMAHIAGLVAARVIPSPFEFAHVVTSTTHKSLRGPRAGLIFYRRAGVPGFGDANELEARVNAAIHPALQGGPHMNAIAGIATALHEVLAIRFDSARVCSAFTDLPPCSSIPALIVSCHLQASTAEFHEYQAQVLRNATTMASSLTKLGYRLVSGMRTANHSKGQFILRPRPRENQNQIDLENSIVGRGRSMNWP